MPSRHAIFVVFAATFALVARVDVRADTEPNFARGVKSYDAKKYREAIGHFQSHLNLHACSLGMKRIGDCYYGLSEFSSALTQYTAAIDRNQWLGSTGNPVIDRALAFEMRGYSLYMLGRHREAVQDLSIASRAMPQEARIHFFQGLSQLYSDELESAVASFTKTLELGYKDSASAFAYRGHAYAGMGQYGRALEHFAEAIQREPTESFSYGSRVLILLCAGDSEHAVEEAQNDLRRPGTLDVGSQWMAIYCYLALRNSGDFGSAVATVNDVSLRSDEAEWPAPIIKYLTGKISAETLRDLAIDAEKMTQVQTIFGLCLAMENKPAESATHLDWVVKSGDQRQILSRLASFQLKQRIFRPEGISADDQPPTSKPTDARRVSESNSIRYRPIRQRPYASRPDEIELGAHPSNPDDIDVLPLLKP